MSANRRAKITDKKYYQVKQLYSCSKHSYYCFNSKIASLSVLLCYYVTCTRRNGQFLKELLYWLNNQEHNIPRSNDGEWHKCAHCNYSHNDIRNLKLHLHTHTRNAPFTCKLCDARFVHSNQLVWHHPKCPKVIKETESDVE